MSDDADLPSVNWFLHQTNISPPPLEEISNGKKPKNKNLSKIDFKKEPIKPPYSYSQLIIMVFKRTPGKKLTLNEIFKYISEEFAFYKSDDLKWKNSVRHLLSLDKRFLKVPREKNERGKGAFWVLDPHLADSETNLKPYYSSRRRKSPMTPISKSPKFGEKNVRPHINPAVIKLLHVLNIRQQAKPKPTTKTPSTNQYDYNPNFSSMDYSTYNEKDFWSDNSYYLTTDSSTSSSSPEKHDWLIEDLSDACPMSNRPHEDFFDSFTRPDEKEFFVDSNISHPWEENSLQNFNTLNNTNNIFNDGFDFYDELLC